MADIVISESLEDIYSPTALKKFKEISIRTRQEIKIKLATDRLENEKMLVLDMTYPTTVVSSRLCLVTVRNAIEACETAGQLADTVRFEATRNQTDLELFSLDFGVWAYTQTRIIETEKPIGSVRCGFEHFNAGVIMKHDFSIPVKGQKLTILEVWNLLQFSFDHIEQRDPTTRIMSLKLFLNEGKKAIVAYRVGATVEN